MGVDILLGAYDNTGHLVTILHADDTRMIELLQARGYIVRPLAICKQCRQEIKK